jgi:3-phenylpropionate/trans-cinnamate dioxygenase ferredoxin reductase subunit
MSEHRIVVVGAGLGGLRTVQGLRRRGSDAAITLIGAEPHLPYDRPPLSKDVLLGKREADEVALTSAEELAALEVEVRLGSPAHGLDLAARQVATSAGEVGFDTLVIATGSVPRRLPHLPRLDGVHELRTLDDALAIRAGLETAGHVVVIGGGFIGAEVASSACALGVRATIVDTLPVLMQRGLGTLLGRRLAEHHRQAGVDLCLGAGVDGLVGTGRVEAVRLADGRVLPADLVVVGVGAVPNTDWLLGSGLEIADGVVCDAHLQAAPGVYAIGDVARWLHPLYGDTIRAEHWTAAVEHAEAVAATLTGQPAVSAAVPLVWSDQHGVKVQIAGRLHPDDEVRLLIDEPTKFLAVAGSEGVQHAAISMNLPARLIKQRQALATRPPWPPLDPPVGPI